MSSRAQMTEENQPERPNDRPAAPALRRLLVVDDQAISRATIRQVLALFPALEVIGEAASGEEALVLVDQLQPDLVLMDLNLPGINGLQATSALKKAHPNLTVFIVSSHPPEHYQTASLAAGASRYIAKSQLRQELARLLPKP